MEISKEFHLYEPGAIMEVILIGALILIGILLISVGTKYDLPCNRYPGESWHITISNWFKRLTK